ncbi:MAG TPA: ATP phosphoribosyltransferase regulatory subunit [Caulobacteraceae bacterium]|nr:ATP phosphoribosyltransferase regulatory subunit [Caulobacteraceae bacterium]
MKLEGAVPAEVLAAIRAPLAAEAAQALRAPTVQPLDLYLDLSGEAMRERLFLVQGSGGEEACLRPDFTVAAAQAQIAAGPGARAFFYEGAAFRVAPPGSERAEEFLQIGLEAFDGPANEAEAEDARLAALAWRSAAAGGRDDLTMVIGDASLLRAALTAIGAPAALANRLQRALGSPVRFAAELEAASQGEAAAAAAGAGLAALLAPLAEEAAAQVLQEIWTLAGVEPVGGRSPAEIVHRLAGRTEAAASPRLGRAGVELIARLVAISGAPQAAAAQIAALGAECPPLRAAAEGWERRFRALEREGAPLERVRFDAGFGRAFGYYDGMLFEVRSAALGDDQPAAAGGRYDGLMRRLGAQREGRAVGCSVRPGRAWKEGGA